MAKKELKWSLIKKLHKIKVVWDHPKWGPDEVRYDI